MSPVKRWAGHLSKSDRLTFFRHHMYKESKSENLGPRVDTRWGTAEEKVKGRNQGPKVRGLTRV